MKLYDQLLYGTLEGGALVGGVAYRARFTGDPGDDLEVAELLELIRDHQSGGTKLVMIEGEFTLVNSDDLFTLAKTLRDHGYVVASITNGLRYYPWMTWVNYSIVELQPDLVWPAFDVQELRWVYSSDRPPILPEHPEKCNLFVVPGTASMSAVLAFVRLRKEAWRIYTPTRTFAVDLTRKEETRE